MPPPNKEASGFDIGKQKPIDDCTFRFRKEVRKLCCLRKEHLNCPRASFEEVFERRRLSHENATVHHLQPVTNGSILL